MSMTIEGVMYFDMPEHDINDIRCDVEFECSNDDFEELDDKLAWDDIVKFYDSYAIVSFTSPDIGGEMTFTEMEETYGETFKKNFDAAEFDIDLEKMREWAEDMAADDYYETRRDY